MVAEFTDEELAYHEAGHAVPHMRAGGQVLRRGQPVIARAKLGATAMFQSGDASPRAAVRRGSGIAGLLTGAWRQIPPEAELDLSALCNSAWLIRTLGVGGLAWWKLRHSGLATTAAAQQMQREYRSDAIQAALHQHSIVTFVSRLRAAGIEPIVIKGWSTARLYPEPALRPYVDVDLVVPPGMGPAADAIVNDQDGEICPDHADVLDASTWEAAGPHGPQADLADHQWGEIFERSQLARLGTLQVRVLGPEDHLRLATVHAFRHGFTRPKWLCDVGLLMERLPESFDWSYCLAGDLRHTRQLVFTVGLAYHVLGANAQGCPWAATGDVPTWLVNSILRRWGAPPVEGPGPSLVSLLRQPTRLRNELYRRWPDPLESTLRLGLGLTGNSRSAAQACDFVWRVGILNAIHYVRRTNGLSERAG